MLFERIAGKSKKKSERQQTIPYLQTIIINAYFCIEFGSPSKIKPLLFWVLYDIVLKTEDILVLVYLVVLVVLGFFGTYLHLKKARISSHLFLPHSLRTRSKNCLETVCQQNTELSKAKNEEHLLQKGESKVRKAEYKSELKQGFITPS